MADVSLSTFTSPIDEQIATLKKSAGPVTGLSATGQTRMNDLNTSKYEAMQDNVNRSEGNVATNKSLNNLFGGDQLSSNVLGRDQRSNLMQSNIGTTNAYERMQTNVKQQDYGFQEAQAHRINTLELPGLQEEKGTISNQYALAEAQAEAAKKGPLGTILGVGGAIVGGIYGGPAGAMAGYSAGQGIGTALS